MACKCCSPQLKQQPQLLLDQAYEQLANGEERLTVFIQEAAHWIENLLRLSWDGAVDNIRLLTLDGCSRESMGQNKVHDFIHEQCVVLAAVLAPNNRPLKHCHVRGSRTS